MRLLVTRPREDAESLARTLADMGHEPILAPMLACQLLSPPMPNLTELQAIVVTSRNALRALAQHPALPEARRLPLFAVGNATAAFARDLGFSKVWEGPGRARDLPPIIQSHCRPEAGGLLYLTGDKKAWDVGNPLKAAGFSVGEVTMYRMAPVTTLPEAAETALATGHVDGVLLLSPRTARLFQKIIRERNWCLPENFVYYCLSPAIAEEIAREAGEGSRRIAVAETPSLEALLVLLGEEDGAPHEKTGRKG